MPFGDFLAKAERLFNEARRGSMPPFSATHIFSLGDDYDFTSSVDEIWADVHPEVVDGIPMPFPDIACASIVRSDSPVNRDDPLCRKAELRAEMLCGKIPDAIWVLDRIVDLGSDAKRASEIMSSMVESRVVLDNPDVKQWFAFMRVHEVPVNVVGWVAGYVMSRPDGTLRVAVAEQTLVRDTAAALKQVAAISHPANYVVRVTPELSPKETRRVASGRPRPTAKPIHYIVVDHEVLVDMRRGSGGHHAPPIPHERRGHWRRLAERCVAARSAGKDKTWVRPAWVGEEEFSGGKNRYKVLMDFGKVAGNA
jgi:hypothetical protein